MRWNSFLDTANRLARGTTEGDWRSTVSRAYYAVFHYFREFLVAHGVVLGRAGTAHFDQYAGLQNCGDAAVAQIASRFDDLRSDRTGADYNLSRTLRQTKAIPAIQEAALIIQDFQGLLAAVPAAQIAAGAKQYLQSIGHIP